MPKRCCRCSTAGFGRPYRFARVVPVDAATARRRRPRRARRSSTDHQTKGRGRLGRAWEDVPGRSILMSVLLLPEAPMPLWPELSLVAGEAVAAALRPRRESTRRSGIRTTSSSQAASSSACSPRRARAASCSASASTSTRPRTSCPSDTAKPPTSLRVELGRDVERAPLLAAILARARARLRRLGRALPAVAHDGRVARSIRRD